MNVLAFDLANNSAWAYVEECDGETSYRVREHGEISVPLDFPLEKRLIYLHKEIELVMLSRSPDFIIYEQVPASWRGSSVVGLQNMQYGAFLTAVGGRNLTIASIAPDKWQRVMLPYTPKRGELKAHERRKLLKKLSMEQAYILSGLMTNNDNVADAINIGIYGLKYVTIER